MSPILILGDNMATFTINPAFELGANMLALDFSSIYYADSYYYGGTIFRAYYGDVTDEFKGVGFKYDSYGTPVGGTVTSYGGFFQGQRLVTIDGVKIAVKDIVKVASTYSLADDMALVKAALAGNDKISGAKGDDKLYAYNGDDIVVGNAGNDTIYGGAGNDKITGGIGRDYLRGEAGSDTFIYKSIKDSTGAVLGRDTVYDFEGSKGDRIDLSAIDANSKTTKSVAFSFIGTKAFGGKAGELRYEKANSDTYIYADVNGDKKADLAIHLDDAVSLTKGYFVL